MATSNTYKGSIRDNVKYVTVNGMEAASSLPYDWGWYSADTRRTAYFIMCHEYGVKTAEQYGAEFAGKYLAECPEEGFILTSGQIAFIIKELENEHSN